MLPVETPFTTYTGLDGKPLDGGYVYFGEPDQNPTTSPIAVYWDAAGTIPAAQPLRTMNGYIARAGAPANVFVSGPYSQLVKDRKGQQVAYARTSADFSVSGAVEEFAKQMAAFATNQQMIGATPQAYGAKGDGVTDDTAAFTAWVAAVTASGLGHVPSGTYRLPTGFAAPSKATVVCAPGAIFDISDGTDNASGIRAFGSVGAAYNLSATPALYGDTLVLSTANAANFAAGDYIEVIADDVADVSDRTGTHIGEMARISAISGGTVTLFGALRAPNLYATNPRIRKITFFENLIWHGGVINGRTSGTDPAQIGFYGKYARNVQTHNVTCNSTMGIGHLWESSYHCWAHNSRTFNNRRPSSGYSVAVGFTSQWCGAVGGEFYRTRHAFTTTGGADGYGIPMDCGITAARSRYAIGDDFDTHSIGINIHMSDCVSEFAAGSAVNIECQSARVRVKAVRPAQYGIAISNYSRGQGTYDVDMDVEDAGISVMRVDTGTIPANQVGINRLTANLTGTAVGSAIDFIWSSVLNLATNIKITGNVKSGAATSAVSAFYCKDIDLSGLKVECTNPAANAFRIDHCDGADLRGARGDLASGSSGISFYVVASSGVDLRDTKGRSPAAVNSRGISLDSTTTGCAFGDLGAVRFIGHTTPLSISGAGGGHTGTLTGSATYDPPSLAAGATQQTTVTVPQATVGDIADVSFSVSSTSVRWSGEVTSVNTVTVTQENLAGGAIDLGSGTLKAIVRKLG